MKSGIAIGIIGFSAVIEIPETYTFPPDNDVTFPHLSVSVKTNAFELTLTNLSRRRVAINVQVSKMIRRKNFAVNLNQAIPVLVSPGGKVTSFRASMRNPPPEVAGLWLIVQKAL
jgi:hypothetical protein